MNEREREVIPNFVGLHKHLALLTRFFLSYMPHPDDIKEIDWDKYLGHKFWNGVSTPLYIAASIDRTDCHLGIIDDAAQWCRPAYEYDLAKANFTSRFVEEATRFIWSWTSFETVTDQICGKSAKHLTGNAIRFLKTAQHPPLEGTCELVNFLLGISPEHIVKKALKTAKQAETEDYLNIHLFREIRNSLVHSSVQDIEPSDLMLENPDKAGNDYRVVRLRVAIRLILLTIQDLAIVYLSQSPSKTWDNEDDEEYDYYGIMSGVEIWRALKYLHVIPQNANS